MLGRVSRGDSGSTGTTAGAWVVSNLQKNVTATLPADLLADAALDQ
jgi:hypothetical protein